MPEADSVPSTPTETVSAAPPTPTRRRALATLDWTAPPVLSGVVLGHSMADAAEAFTPSPDAELIRACAEFVRTKDAIEAERDVEDDDPLWGAYDRLGDAIVGTKATTLDGLTAKASAAKLQAWVRGVGECQDGIMACDIAWSIVNDLVGLAGARAV